MRKSVRIGLLLVVLSVFLIVSSSSAAVAAECMGTLSDVSVQCGCPAGHYCG